MKKGIVLEVDDDFVTLLTPEGEFVQVKNEHDCEIGEEIEGRVMGKPIVRHHSLRYVILSLVAACVLIFATLFHLPSNEVYAYMSIDINPSVEIGVNEQLQVLKIQAYNREGKDIVSRLSDWNKKKFVDVTREIIELSMKRGYLQKGGQVLIATVEKEHHRNSSHELSTELTKIQRSYQQKNIVVKTTTSTMGVRKEAIKKGITTGKFLQIEKKKEKNEGETKQKSDTPLLQKSKPNAPTESNHKKEEKQLKKELENHSEKQLTPKQSLHKKIEEKGYLLKQEERSFQPEKKEKVIKLRAEKQQKEVRQKEEYRKEGRQKEVFQREEYRKEGRQKGVRQKEGYRKEEHQKEVRRKEEYQKEEGQKKVRQKEEHRTEQWR